jgi:predicted DNA-binding protein
MRVKFDDETVSVSAKVPPEIVERLDNYCREAKFRPTRSAVIRELIEDGLPKLEKQATAIAVSADASS